MTPHTTRLVLLAAMLGLSASLAHSGAAIAMGDWVEGEEADACDNDDGAFNDAAFVLADHGEVIAAIILDTILNQKSINERGDESEKPEAKRFSRRLA